MAKGGLTKVRAIAAALLTGQTGDLLLQQRDDIPGILFPGYIGLFGGHVEAGESFLQAVRREIREETALDLPADDFQPLVSYTTRYPDGNGVDGEFYLVRGVVIDPLNVTEGQLKAISPAQIANFYAQMTPATCFVVKTFLESGSWKD